MNNRGAVMAEAIVPFAPKSNARAETGDPLDRAGQTILSALDRAAGAAEEKYRQAVETTHKVSAQLRAAEDHLKERPGIKRIGLTAPKNGCIKSRWKLSRNSLEGPISDPHRLRSQSLVISSDKTLAARAALVCATTRHEAEHPTKRLGTYS